MHSYVYRLGNILAIHWFWLYWWHPYIYRSNAYLESSLPKLPSWGTYLVFISYSNKLAGKFLKIILTQKWKVRCAVTNELDEGSPHKVSNGTFWHDEIHKRQHRVHERHCAGEEGFKYNVPFSESRQSLIPESPQQLLAVWVSYKLS